MWKTVYILHIFLGLTIIKFGRSDDDGKICDDEQCKFAATIINNAMDKTVDPCDNFYNYACGGWEFNYPLPNEGKVWNLEEMTEENAMLEVKEILEGEDKDDDITPLKYERMIYKSCMDTDKIEEYGLEPVENILVSLGGWPIMTNTEDWNDENNEWQKIDQYFMKFGEMSTFYNIHVSTDDRNSSFNIIMLERPSETLFDELMVDGENETVLAEYTEFVKDVVSSFIKSSNKSIPEENVMNDIEDIVAFEKRLRAIKFPENEDENSESSPTYFTIEELQKFYEKEDMKSTAKINWLQLLKNLFEDIENVSIDDTEEMEIENVSYLHELSNLLEKTPNRVLVNYVYWRFVSLSLEYLNDEMRDLLISLTVDSEDVMLQERWEECKDSMRLGMGYRHEFVRRHFSESTKKMVDTIANELRNEMMNEIEHSSWVDEETKDFSIAKLHDLKLRIGNSWFLMRKDFLEHSYDELEPTENYFENMQQIRKFELKRDLKKLRNKRKHSKWVRVDPLWATTIYDLSRNVLAVSAGQLTVPVIGASIPSAVTYGYIAPTFGQLMAQTMEKEVDTDSYLRPWYSVSYEIREPYQAITDCFTSQYTNYTSESWNLSENIYDNIGLKVAYDAFKSTERNDETGNLPELGNLTDDQLFFVSYAMRYCESASPEYISERNFLSLTPNEYRVIGAVSNSKEFANVFNCAADAPMNPTDKCEV
ncbi:hypothetical protein QAD02_006484 [Eretmocerus hayati]|uniref:Uncharacterized protein n=1 Tax=Eretmocerus hayati TaxID=131215 RepID=A0ACC2N1C7_9HYME|nr:hypothetical protein QAD02_006484 [Eretmocerus hayati]